MTKLFDIEGTGQVREQVITFPTAERGMGDEIFNMRAINNIRDVEQQTGALGLLRQGYIQLQHRAVSIFVQLYRNLILLNTDVFLDNANDLLLHFQQEVWLIARRSLVCHYNVQALPGIRGRIRATLFTKIVE
jgi:hypothetical protein